MTSDKQIEANRRNARHSTGPRTEEGKAKSSMNGFKSSFSGLTEIMTDEDRIAKNEFVAAYIQDLDPLGPVEVQMARTLAMDNWRLNRIKAVEENIFAWGYASDPGLDAGTGIPRVDAAFAHALSYMTHAERINKISLYESRLSRIIARNTKLLMERQAQRPQRRAQPASPQAEMVGTYPHQSLTQTARTGHGNGFVEPLYKTASGPAPNRSGLIPTEIESETKDTGQAA